MAHLGSCLGRSERSSSSCRRAWGTDLGRASAADSSNNPGEGGELDHAALHRSVGHVARVYRGRPQASPCARNILKPSGGETPRPRIGWMAEPVDVGERLGSSGLQEAVAGHEGLVDCDLEEAVEALGGSDPQEVAGGHEGLVRSDL